MGSLEGTSSRQPQSVNEAFPNWHELPGSALQVLCEGLFIDDFKALRLVCVPWMLACRCRRLRLILSCIEHEYIWRSDPSWLARLISDGRLHISRLRLQQVPLGHGRTRPGSADTLPFSLGQLSQMVEQAPPSLEEVQLLLHPLAEEGLDNGPTLRPAWVACIARMARCSPASAAGIPAPHEPDHPHQRHRHRLGTAHRRVKIDATALQQGYCGVPGSACLSEEVLRQLSEHVPGLSSMALSIRTSSTAAATQLAAMQQLQVLRLVYEETLSPGVELEAGTGTAGAFAAAGGALAAGAPLAAALAAGAAAAGGQAAPALHPGPVGNAFASSFLFPLRGLSQLQHLSIAMAFPSFGPGSSHFRRGSSPWVLQLLPSFPHLRHLDVSLVLQDVAPLLCRGTAAKPSAPASDGSFWGFGPAFPPGTLQHLQEAVIRVRGYAARDQAAASGRALEALAHELAALPELRELTLGICTSQAACDIPHGVWDALLTQPLRSPCPEAGGTLGMVASPGACGSVVGSGAERLPRFKVALELSSECSRFGAFGLPNPLLHAGSREGLLVLPLEELRNRFHAAVHNPHTASTPPTLPTPAPPPHSHPSHVATIRAPSRGGGQADASSFPLASLRVTRSPPPPATAALLGHHHLLLMPYHLGLLSALHSLTDLHLEFRLAALDPWDMQSQVEDAAGGIVQRVPRGSGRLGEEAGSVQGGAKEGGLSVGSVGSLASVGGPSSSSSSFSSVVSDGGSSSCSSSRGASGCGHELSSGTATTSGVGSDAIVSDVAWRGGSGCEGSSGSSCLLWLARGLPLLRSLYLRSYGTQYVGGLSLARSPPLASVGVSDDGSSSAPAAHQQGRQSGLGPEESFEGLDFLGEAIGSSFGEGSPRSMPHQGAATVHAPAPGLGPAKRGALHGTACSASWLRFDDECAAAFASAWGRQMTELQLHGLDMERLTHSGLEALEEMMPGLSCLALTKTPSSRPVTVGQWGVSTQSRLPLLGSTP